MHDLIAIEKIAQWQKLKALVLDSVSMPKRVYDMALNEFMECFSGPHFRRTLALRTGAVL